MMPQDPEIDGFFDDLPLFCDLTPLQMEQARAVLSAVCVGAGHTLIAADTPGDMVYIVASGSVRICAPNENVIVGLRGPGEILGEMSVIDGMKRSATVIAQQPTMLFCLSQADFWGVLWEMPPITYNVMRLLTQRTRVLTSQVQALALLDVPGRLARQIVTLAEEYGQSIPENDDARLIPFHLSESQIASMTGATGAEIGQLLGEWKSEGLLDVGSEQIVVYRADKLREFYQDKLL